MIAFVFSLLFSLTALVGGHYLIYFTLVRTFEIERRAFRLVLSIGLVVLAAGFVVSSLFVRLSANSLTHAFYWLSSVWLGLFLHLISAIAGIWFFLGVTRVTGHTVNKRWVSGTCLVTAAIVTTYGMLNAMSVQVRNVDITIDDLPEHWRGKTLAHISDVHLGPVHGVRFLNRVIGKVNALQPELILITGDLFDGSCGDVEPFIEPLSTLDANRGAFFVAGNHEGYLGLSVPLEAVERAGIRILDDQVIVIDGVQIVGVSFPEYNGPSKQRAVERLAEQIAPEMPSILLYHTPTDVSEEMSSRADQQTRTYLSPDVDFSFNRAVGVDVQLSGHTHEGQIFPFTYLTKWIFGGYHYGLHKVGETSLYISSGTGTWGPPLRTGSRSEVVAIRLN